MGTYGVGSSNSPIVVDDSSDDDSVDARQVDEQLELLAGSGSGVSRTPSVIALDESEPEIVDASTDVAGISNGMASGHERRDEGESDFDNEDGDGDKYGDWEQEDEDEYEDEEGEPESGDEDLANFMEKWMEEGEDSERTWVTVRNGGYRILARIGYQPGMGLGPRFEGALFVALSAPFIGTFPRKFWC